VLSRLDPVFISQLWRKIEAQPAKPRYLLTDPGIGYRFYAIDDLSSSELK
jgi:DNA-binding response OmpR family regulator